MSTTVRNRSDKDRKRRRKLREQLRAEGQSEQLIEKAIEAQRYADLVARHGLDLAREVLYTEAHRQNPHRDDTGFKPVEGDPLLRGPARVTGITAKVVRRRDTITRFQYDKATE